MKWSSSDLDIFCTWSGFREPMNECVTHVPDTDGHEIDLVVGGLIVQ